MVLKDPCLVYWLNNNLYLNITNRCSNNCYFCIRNFRNGVGRFNLKLKREPRVSEVISELQSVINRRSWNEIVFCGFGEPFERLDCLLEVTRWIRRYHGKTVKIRIDTNGHGCLINEGRDIVKELREVSIDRISVSLNAHDKETYNRVCRPRFDNAFEKVLEFIENTKKYFFVNITTVAIPEVDILKVRKIAERLGVEFRAREFVPCFLN
ncbi:MAG: TatD family nuclease-associated radical SAM protein [Candidatus Bathyarchaeia archaeon]